MATNRTENTSEPTAHVMEPLGQLARFAWETAPQLCRPEHGCLDYHRSWGLVRLLLGEGRLPAGGVFFHRELSRILKAGGRRILVSGGADSGLLTHVLNASRVAGVKADIVFADLCQTACELNARMAKEAQVNIQTVTGDICDLEIDAVDAIVAHTFLPFFEGPKRQAVLQAWSRNCKPGGTVLMSNVLKANETEETTEASPEVLAAKASQLLHRACEAGYPLNIAQDMVQTAERFWRMTLRRPPGLTEHNLHVGLKRAGFGSISVQYNDAGVSDGPKAMVRNRRKENARAEIMAIKNSVPEGAGALQSD